MQWSIKSLKNYREGDEVTSGKRELRWPLFWSIVWSRLNYTSRKRHRVPSRDNSQGGRAIWPVTWAEYQAWMSLWVELVPLHMRLRQAWIPRSQLSRHKGLKCLSQKPHQEALSGAFPPWVQQWSPEQPPGEPSAPVTTTTHAFWLLNMCLIWTEVCALSVKCTLGFEDFI